jgi:hypothetical protein
MIVAGSASPLLLSSAGGYNLTNSLRFRSSASAYLNRTPASAGNRRTFTYSVWLKRGVLDASYNKYFFSARPSSSVRDGMYFGTNQTLSVFANDGSSALLTTTQVFRDVSAWYHIVVAVDTTQATSSNRVKIYVNGSQVTAFGTATYPTQNYDWAFNNSVIHTISDDAANAPTGLYHFDGYMAEINSIDGQALTPSSFGETSSSTGVWIPKKYTGTYGTNGFYLPFTDNSALTTSSNVGLGKDFSGNSNYWTTNNISITSGSTYDSMTDVPTLTSATAANYCVLNPLDTGNTPTNGNLTYPAPSAAWKVNRATFSIPETAKAYWEIKISGDSSNNISCGVDTGLSSLTAQLGSTSAGWAIVPPNSTGSTSANKYNNGSSTSVTLPSNSGTNDVYMFAVDRNTNSIWIGINGSFVGTVGTSGQIFNNLPSTGTLFPAICTYNKLIDVNFGQQPFAYTPPTGFNRLNTFNLPTPTIGATASTQAGDYFNPVLYTGNGGTQTVSGVGFQPDLTWVKDRSAANSHWLNDAVRGAGLSLSSNTTEEEKSYAAYFTAFNSNGFALAGGTGGFNANGDSYVAWNWKANGAGSSNTAGSITSTVSANTTAGFSVVTFTTQSSGTATVGHGLGVAPSMIITKLRTDASNWNVFHSSVGNTGILNLNTTGATTTNSQYWNNTSPTSSVFTTGTWYTGSLTAVAYCFAQIAGYSAFGSYTGNGSSDGPFIYTGFRPKFFMTKITSAAGYDWIITDTSRDTYNVSGLCLEANLSNAESTNGGAFSSQSDILSNGFKIRNSGTGANGSGGTYIYMAFAESPFRYANAR